MADLRFVRLRHGVEMREFSHGYGRELYYKLAITTKYTLKPFDLPLLHVSYSSSSLLFKHGGAVSPGRQRNGYSGV